MQEVVVINGSGQSGKDTFILLCSKYAKVQNESSIDPSKHALCYLCGTNWGDEKLPGSKGEKLRWALSELKKLSIEVNDYPFRYIKDKIKEFRKSNIDILFIHVREIPEIERLVEAFKCKTVLVTSTRVPKITSNSSDGLVENYKYDVIVANDTTLDDLDEKAKWFCYDYLLGGD